MQLITIKLTQWNREIDSIILVGCPNRTLTIVQIF